MNNHSSHSTRLLAAAGIAILTLAVTSGCNDGSPTAPSLGQKTLAVGQNASIANGTTVSFDRVVSDSRCPAGIVCAWEGEVTVALTLGGSAGPTSFTLSDHDRTKVVGRFLFELVSVQPGRVADQSIPPAAYRITIRVAQ